MAATGRGSARRPGAALGGGVYGVDGDDVPDEGGWDGCVAPAPGAASGDGRGRLRSRIGRGRGGRRCRRAARREQCAQEG